MSNNAQVDVFQLALIVADFDEAIDYYTTCLDSIQLRIPTWAKKSDGCELPPRDPAVLCYWQRLRKKIRPDT